MNKNDINERLSALGIYSDYYYRKELKPLSQIINFDEKLNCVFTGVYDGYRHLVAVTDFRVIIIGAPTLGKADLKYVRRKGIVSWEFRKRFFVSSVTIKTDESEFVFKQVQRARYKLFNWAMELPVKEYDE